MGKSENGGGGYKYAFVDRIDIFVPQVTDWHQSLVMPSSDPQDKIVDPIHKLMIYSFRNCCNQ